MTPRSRTPETPAGGAPLAPPGARFDPVTGAELGTGATAFALYGKGTLKPKSKLVNGYNIMLNTMISTL